MDTNTLADYFPSLPRSILANVRTLSEEFSAVQMLKFIEESFLDNDLTFADAGFQLGMLCALTLSLRTTSVRMTEQWEDVLWIIIHLVFYRFSRIKEEGTMINFDALMSTTLKPWILTIFTDAEFCPNPYQRLKMMGLINMFPENFLQDANSGRQAAAGLLINSKYMDNEHIKAFGFYNLIEMLKRLEKYDHLAAIVAAAVDQVRRINVGPEVSLLYNVLQISKQVAKTALDKINQLGLYKFEILIPLYVRVLVDLRTTKKAYAAPGLANAAAETLVSFTALVVTIGSKLEDEYGDQYRLCVEHLNSVYKEISEDSEYTSLYQVLRLSHGQHLSYLSKKATDFGCCVSHFPIPFKESSEEVPEEFTDTVTQEVMEAPVLLHSSKMVIDDSTLVRLLLESPFDPFTRHPLDHGSYSRLPELQAIILAWKKNTKFMEKSTMDDNIEDVSVCKRRHTQLYCKLNLQLYSVNELY